VLDAVIIAIQMIVTHCKKLKYEKCVAVFTDAKHKIDWLDYEAISGALQENNITLLIK
jgi:ATP-dependent DNA helicase 2 subunit 2